MKIAFTSCMSSTVFEQQPVWDRIAAQQPDRLLLLGDSVYLDIRPYVGEAGHPREMGPADFMQHLLGRWQLQLDQPQFRALVQRVPTDAVWDDHDFLWDESHGEKAIEKRVYREHVRASRAVFNAFRRTLDARLAPGSFPTAYNDALLYRPDEPPPGYRLRVLAPDLRLHLTDGRSWRVRRDLLGAEQRARIAAEMQAAPDAVHLLASGSVLRGAGQERWEQFDDLAWLTALARRHRILVLSGDIHRNRFDSIDLGQGRWLHDATASGAAIRTLVSTGEHCENHGLLTVDGGALRLAFFSRGQPDAVGPCAIDRASWRASRTA